jgi:hypothetical protein
MDLSVLKNFALRDLANHANFGLPVTDLASPGFARILEASSARLVQPDAGCIRRCYVYLLIGK